MLGLDGIRDLHRTLARRTLEAAAAGHRGGRLFHHMKGKCPRIARFRGTQLRQPGLGHLRPVVLG
jgi:hypothetical protein